MLVSDDEYPKYWYMPHVRLLYRQLKAKAAIEYWLGPDDWTTSVSRRSLPRLAYRCRLLGEPRQTNDPHVAAVSIMALPAGEILEVEC